MKVYSPIAIFCYNRPHHLKQVLDSLKNSKGIEQSVVYFFQDGPKPDADERTLKKIQEVNSIIRVFESCKEKSIISHPRNIGLNASIESGIEAVFKNHDQIIVLEDDIIVSEGFLEFMNQAFEVYKNDPTVYHISGYTPKFWRFVETGDTFCLRTAQIWGWGTWKEKWLLYYSDYKKAYEKISQSNKDKRAYSFHPSLNYYQLLKKTVEGDTTIWDTKWSSALFVSQKLSLYSRNSMCKNIGLDSSGTHCDETSAEFFVPNNFSLLNRLGKIHKMKKIEENCKAKREMQLFLSRKMGRRQLFSDLTFGTR